MRRPPSHTGHALTGAMIFLVIVALLWTAVLGQTIGYLRVEKACATRQLRSVGPTRALAWGMTLLETAPPPASPYSCRMVITGQSPGVYVATFVRTGPKSYIVSVRPAEDGDSGLPVAPQRFGD